MSLFAPAGDAIGRVGAVQARLEQIGCSGTGAMVGQRALDCHIAAWGKLGAVAEKAVFAHCTLSPEGACLARKEQVELGGECAVAKVNA